MRAPASGSWSSRLGSWRKLTRVATGRRLALPARQPPSAPVALAIAFAIFFLACLTAGWLSLVSLPGFGFAAGAVIAVGSVRRRELLIVVVAPPALFLLAVGLTGLLSAWQNGAPISPLPIAAACLLTLSAAAPWLFGGLAGVVVLAEVRGLHQCVRDLRAALAAQPGQPARTSRQAVRGQPARFPEPGLPDQAPLSGRWQRARGAIHGAKRK